MLRKLELKTNYSSETDNLYTDFFHPTLSHASIYRRAVGYFSLGVLLNAPAALSRIVEGNGKAELIFGQLVSAEDFDAIQAGIANSCFVDDLPSFETLLEDHSGSLLEYRVRLIAWLFTSGRLQMKVAIRPHGLFHQKIGLLEDGLGDVVSFTGSMNETMSALDPRYNSEEIAVFKSWIAGQAEYVESHRERFSKLWSGDTGSATIICALPEAIEAGLKFVSERYPGKPDATQEDTKVSIFLGQRPGGGETLPTMPTTLNGKPFGLRDHQVEALKRWSENNFNGILELATGAGKTITAIFAAAKTVSANEGMVLIVAVPYQDLADQWCEELRAFNILPIRCYGSRNDWEPQIQAYLNRNRGIQKEFLAIVVVNKTLVSSHFQAYAKQFDGDRLFFIGDECHHHGAEGFTDKLIPHVRFRIGLSATPFHYLDEEKNLRLAAVYDRSVFQYTLFDAVKAGVLTPYEYMPIPVELTNPETLEYVSLTKQISRLYVSSQNQKSSDSRERLSSLLMKRSRLVGAAANKLVALRALLEEQGKVDPYSLFYCGDGRTQIGDSDFGIDENDDEVELKKQRHAVAQILLKMGISVSPFTSDENRRQRREILAKFKNGETQALVAIRCLDEGIDVPACRSAYLIASSRNPRQFIQRRGRILRRAEGKEYARIYDFVVVLPVGAAACDDTASDFLKNELARVADFARNSKYPSSSVAPLLPWLKRYDLEHFAS